MIFTDKGKGSSKKTSLLKDTLHTKIHEFDPSLGRQQDVIAFDITVDGFVDVQVLESLWRKAVTSYFLTSTCLQNYPP